MMFVPMQRWEIDPLPGKSLGSLQFTSNGDALVWNQSVLFTPDNPRGEALDGSTPPRRKPVGYSQQQIHASSSPSGRFTLSTKTSLQPDGYYDHAYVTDVVLADQMSEARHHVASCEERERFVAHALSDQGILIYSHGERLLRFDALADSDRTTTLASGWRGLLTVPDLQQGQTILTGIEPESSSAGLLELADDGNLIRTITTDAPWMGYIEDIDGLRRLALLALLDHTGAGFVSLNKRFGLVDFANERYLESDLFDANIHAVALCPGKDEVAILCHDRSLHWLCADW